MTTKKLKSLKIDNLPLFIEVTDIAVNPNRLPNTYPFELAIDDELGKLYQVPTNGLMEIVSQIYDYGSTVGNAMDESGEGFQYAEDFLDYIKRIIPQGSKVLEIGAGRGYLCKRMIEEGYDVTGLEPGNAQSQYWKQYGVEIIKDKFPSSLVSGPYDAIVFYGVLEHIVDIKKFLADVERHLNTDGKIVISVPDCEMEIVNGDPSILLHEHFHYFSNGSLRRTLARNKFAVSDMSKSGYGRCIYVTARHDTQVGIDEISKQELENVNNYASRVNNMKRSVEENIANLMLNEKTLGVYCPGRALALLPQDIVNRKSLRFFDDAVEFYKKYYPPFEVEIENFDDFVKNPPDYLWIMSRTFGEKLKNKINEYNLPVCVLTIDELQV